MVGLSQQTPPAFPDAEREIDELISQPDGIVADSAIAIR
jgi:hypothetical protein